MFKDATVLAEITFCWAFYSFLGNCDKPGRQAQNLRLAEMR